MTSPNHPNNAENAHSLGQGAEFNDSPRIRILLVDDDELFRESLAMNLVDEDFNVTECENGRACMALLNDRADFDLILLDWRMPGMSGIEVVQ